jgi:hypothetical protein
LIVDVDGRPVEREVSGGIAGHVDNAYTEVRIAQLGCSPVTTPGIGGAAERKALLTRQVQVIDQVNRRCK